MKRMIMSATTTKDIINIIVDGLKQCGCTFAKKSREYIHKQEDTYCVLKFTLPSGKQTQATFWYNFKKEHVEKEGNHSTLVRWDSSWSVNPDGTVVDSSGEVIGTAVVRRIVNEKHKTVVKEYSPDSITIDSGHIVIEHPELAQDYVSLVNHLEKRKVSRFS